jgi:hypothetical protein
MKCLVIGLVGFLLSALACEPAGAWSHSGAYGTASGGGGSWSAHGAYGTTAYHSSAYSTTAYHTTTSGTTAYYGGAYATYHPPTTVNYYGSSCGNCGGWSTAGAAAAGAAVGVVAGTTNTAYAMGAIYATLPTGCAISTVASTTYYHCSNAWFQPSYGANGVYYRVVPAP